MGSKPTTERRMQKKKRKDIQKQDSERGKEMG